MSIFPPNMLYDVQRDMMQLSRAEAQMRNQAAVDRLRDMALRQQSLTGAADNWQGIAAPTPKPAVPITPHAVTPQPPEWKTNKLHLLTP